MRGEDGFVIRVGAGGGETPPRAWGRRYKGTSAAVHTGNTPTCVGKTTLICVPTGGRAKHPHVRGEDRPGRQPPGSTKETPPRAWGRPFAPVSDLLPGRNTPTCVGKTLQVCVVVSVTSKHPHVRGEDTTSSKGCSTPAETPPRAWGRQMPSPSLQVKPGNTPTCVGKTKRKSRKRKARWKHPHVRGEDL